ncbi:hypothetical protein BBO99_00006185 [Phytophthora kernoviae]|uniref:PH domain-containing protein n=2 Tax=Phytophthora kernoviae TaxID=325452 RepID=A0A3R7MMB7_9STRA|nr:hypothetical protein G195_007018 [Phytophthora kernoviae 00238/432]KAG2522058.1 hypothetical protein JM16_006034 [Phytophthora kernoviae]KAG2523642.1 hypothetical protein JM18_005701 [Phytophthora kernoviae]RLN10424.1 hypothetical protein BBI17_006289 [Phytophthora kernoviae]RLN78132.1 hypothetical protein BBO99_00006185 [Phytophthora kernoviae]
MASAFPQKAKAGLCALISCCFQPSHSPEPTDESICSGNFDRVVKFGFVEPVRLCHNCAATAKNENGFYEKHLPLLETGDLFSKYGLLRKRHVLLKFVRDKNFFQYQKVDPESRAFEGEIKAIPLDNITDVRGVDASQDNADVGIVIAVGDQTHRFDATTALKREQWVEAITSARSVRGALLAAEREKRAKQVEKENEEIRRMSENLQKMEERRTSFQEDRIRRRAEKREQLRAKYNLAAAS